MASRPARLAKLFRQNGYVRMPNPERRAAERSAYKKGWEVRLVAPDAAGAEAIVALASELGCCPGAPFAKGKQVVVPLYGLDAVDAFLSAHRVPRTDARRVSIRLLKRQRANRRACRPQLHEGPGEGA